MSVASDGRTLGIALDATHLAVAWRDGDGPHSRWQSITAPCDGSPDSVAQALGGLISKAPLASGASVTLSRPIAHSRTLRLPRMPRATLEGVLARDWSRHVIGHRSTPHTVAVRVADRGSWITAFAPTDLLEAFAEKASTHGWRLLEMKTADDALAGAARELAPQEARSGDCFVVLCDVSGPTDAVHLRGGMPWRGRRLLHGATDADIAAFMRAGDGAASAPLVLLGHATRTAALARALGTLAIRTRAIDIGLAPESSSVELMAAAGSMTGAALPLHSPGTQRLHARRMRSTTRWLALAAAAALILALGLDRWRVQRSLATVQRARADLSAPVRSAMTARSELENAAEVAATLADREAGASQVSGVLAAITVALPSGASLTAMHVAGDSVMIEGESTRSATVYDALRGIPTLEQVKLAAPLRQERQAGDVAVEHFAFSARLRHSPPSVREATR